MGKALTNTFLHDHILLAPSFPRRLVAAGPTRVPQASGDLQNT